MQQWAQILQKFQRFFYFINKMPKRFRGKCIVQMKKWMGETITWIFQV